MLQHLLFSLVALGFAGPPEAATPEGSAQNPSAELQAKVQSIFEDSCTSCHDTSGDPGDPGGLDLESPVTSLIGRKSAAVDRLLVDPGNPDGSYLLVKMREGQAMEGDLMPLGDDPLPQDQLDAVRDWIASLPKAETPPLEGGGDGAQGEGGDDGGTADAGGTADGGTGGGEAPRRSPKPFHGTEQIVLPTTTTLGRNTLQYRIDHRFGRLGTERGAFGLDAGVVMSMGMAYGILDGWDVRLRRSATRKNWELGTKYIALRQEDGRPLSLGGYVSVEYFRDFDVANPWVGNFQALISRLWFDRWSTMVTLGYHLRTNHNSRVIVDRGEGPVAVRDRRDTVVVGFASTVWLGKKRKFGIDLEYFLPIPDGGTPNRLYYRGGDADLDGTKIGSWAIGGSYYTGKHFFNVFFTNNRGINTNVAAAGGHSGNPFDDPTTDHENPLNEINFFLGFNLGRNFTLGKNIRKAKEKRKAKKGGEA